MQMAIIAYKTKKFRSISRTAIVFAVPESTLVDRLKGINARSETRANSHRLTALEEEVLTK